ncbi:hypothetical protein AAG570_002508 [Ranatra chinensis]|uniref:Uncharacterized protein n=1 Tax=Ranatra chinensis TaxID=642074 RepID=A0ABD0YUG6_9HEMI
MAHRGRVTLLPLACGRGPLDRPWSPERIQPPARPPPGGRSALLRAIVQPTPRRVQSPARAPVTIPELLAESAAVMSNFQLLVISSLLVVSATSGSVLQSLAGLGLDLGDSGEHSATEASDESSEESFSRGGRLFGLPDKLHVPISVVSCLFSHNLIVL